MSPETSGVRAVLVGRNVRTAGRLLALAASLAALGAGFGVVVGWGPPASGLPGVVWVGVVLAGLAAGAVGVYHNDGLLVGALVALAVPYANRVVTVATGPVAAPYRPDPTRLVLLRHVLFEPLAWTVVNGWTFVLPTVLAGFLARRGVEYYRETGDGPDTTA